jgi:hypothetical protein
MEKILAASTAGEAANMLLSLDKILTKIKRKMSYDISQ